MKKLILFLTGIFFTVTGIAQSLSINTDGSTANASAILDIKSITKGMLVPRMSKTEKNAIASPATGLLIFQNAPDSIGFHYYDGTQWRWLEAISSTPTAWKITGNAGTDTAVNYIGTSDDMPLRFKQNGQYMGQWDINKGNYFIGERTGILKPATMQHSIAVGDSALAATGSGASSHYNIAIGYKALKNHQSQIGNIAIGAFTLQNFVSNGGGGFGSVAVGYQAMNKMLTGEQNAALGAFALVNDTTGSGNTAMGAASLGNKKTGNFNTAGGFNAGVTLRTGSNNTFLGGNAYSSLDSLQNATAIGAFTQVDTSNAMVLGSISGVNSATANTNVAIGTTKPKSALHVSRGSSGNNLTISSNRISLFEDNVSNYMQLLSPDANETGILAGNASTLIKSGIVFAADSAVLIRTGGNNTRIFAAKTGLVGIGNTNPQSRLHVSNGTVASGQYYSSAIAVLESNTSNFLQLMNPSSNTSGIFSGTELTNARSGIFFNPDSSIAFNSPGFSSRLTVKNDGNILIPGLLGIGNTNPQTKLHVSKGTTAGAVYFSIAAAIVESSSTNFMQLMNPSNSSAAIVSGTELTNARSSIFFNADSSINFNSPGFINRISVKNDGDILIPGSLGIGNTSPQTRLHVSKGTTAGAAYFSSGTAILESSSTNFTQLMNPSASAAFIISGTEVTSSRSGISFNADSSISFATGGFSTRMTILKNGNTGINTTTPSAMLDVNGSFKLGVIGTVNSAIIKTIVSVNAASVLANSFLDVDITVANASTAGAVSISPAADLPAGITIASARVSVAGTVRMRLWNETGANIDPPSMNYIIGIIQ